MTILIKKKKLDRFVIERKKFEILFEIREKFVEGNYRIFDIFAAFDIRSRRRVCNTVSQRHRNWRRETVSKLSSGALHIPAFLPSSLEISCKFLIAATVGPTVNTDIN